MGVIISMEGAMWYLSGKEHGGTGDGTAVTERAARARDPYGLRALLARPAPQPSLNHLMAQQQLASPFGMPGMMGMGNPFAGVDFGGGPMGGFPLGGNPFGAGPMLTGWEHHLLFQQMQAQRAARERWDALP